MNINTHPSRKLGRTLRVALLASCTGVSAVPLAAPAQAQEEGAAASDQAIVVTGSRIVRRDYESNSPIVTVGQQLLQQSPTAALEQSLNKLPQFTPAQTPTMSGDIQPTATNTPGAATVSLRGIGANRNLVLIDGRRATPGNASGVVDISTIPSAAIERVEVISGGASATYGADAVAGVTNFILKKNFKGLEVDGQLGLSSRGDGREMSVSGIMGTDFAEGRGNISFALSYNDRNLSYQRDRPWFRNLWTNPTVNGNGFFLDRPGVVQTANTVNRGTVDALFPGNGGVIPTTANVTYYLNKDGSLFVNGSWQRPNVGVPGTTYTPFSYGFNSGETDGFPYKRVATGLVSPNDTYLPLVLPLSRYNAFVRGNYEVNDWVGVFGQALYSHVSTATLQEPGPISGGWGASIPWGTGVYTGSGSLTNVGNPSSVILNGMAFGGSNYIDSTPGNLADNPTNPAFRTVYGNAYGCANNVVGGCTNTALFQNSVPAALQQMLNGRVNPNAPFTIAALMPTPRETFTDVSTFNLLAGLEGKVPGTDWTWEVFANHGESETFARQTGIFALSRLRLLLAAPDMGKGFSQRGNVEQSGFGASTATCTTGLDLFGAANFSTDCLNAISADLKNRSKVVQQIWEGNAQGTLLDLPAGKLGAAVGLSHRSLDYKFLNDTLTSQGRSFTDQALGIYPSGDSFGAFTVSEAYGEVLIPVLRDIPGIRSLSLELGGRVSDYSTTGTSYTYKALGDWEITRWLRIRGGYNRAERAPNIGELFLAPQQTFGTNSRADVCSRLNPAPFSANPGKNSNAANVEAVCRIQMDASGDPTAKDTYYAAAQSNAASGSAFPTTIGNPNLTPEKADTYTLGAVISSPFDSTYLSRLRLTVDYFRMKVTNAIGVKTVGTALQECFDPALNPAIANDPAAAAAAAGCQQITRNAQNGSLGNVTVTYINSGRFLVQGIDAQFDWAIPVGPGTFSINALMNYLLNFKSSELPTLPMVDYVGTFGTTASGLNNGPYRYRIFTTATYSVGPASLSLQWQHLPSIEDTAEALAPTTVTGAPAYDIFHLNGSIAITKDATIRFGIENLFDKAPPLSGVNLANTNPLANGNLPGGSLGTPGSVANSYDTIGRRFFVGAKFKF